MAATAISAWRGWGRQDVDEVRLEAQELVEASHEPRLREERGPPVEQILTAVAQRDDHRVRVVAVAEAVQVEDATEPDDADANGTRHREKLPSADARRRTTYCSWLRAFLTRTRGPQPPQATRGQPPSLKSAMEPVRPRTRRTRSTGRWGQRGQRPSTRPAGRCVTVRRRIEPSIGSRIRIRRHRGRRTDRQVGPRTEKTAAASGRQRGRAAPPPAASRRRLDRNLAGRQS